MSQSKCYECRGYDNECELRNFRLSRSSRITCFSDCLGTTGFLKCPVFPGYHIFVERPGLLGTSENFGCLVFPDKMFFCEFPGNPEFLKCPVFPGDQDLLNFQTSSISEKITDVTFFRISSFFRILGYPRMSHMSKKKASG